MRRFQPTRPDSPSPHRPTSAPPLQLTRLHEIPSEFKQFLLEEPFTEPSQTGNDTDLVSSEELQLPNFYAVNRDPEMAGRSQAGMRVFGTLLLNAWRKQRTDVHNLTKKLSKYKFNYIKSKATILHLDNAVMLEKQHNEKLFSEFKMLNNELEKANISNQLLKNKVDELQMENFALNETIRHKDTEYLKLLEQANQSQKLLNQLSQESAEMLQNLNTSQAKITELSQERLLLVTNYDGLKGLLEKHAANLKKKEAALQLTNKELITIRSQLQTSKERIAHLKKVAHTLSVEQMNRKQQQEQLEQKIEQQQLQMEMEKVAAKVKEVAKAKEAAKAKEQAKAKDAAKVKDSPRTKESPKTKEATKTKDSPKTKEATKAKDSPKPKVAIKTDEAAESKKVVEAKEVTEVKEKLEPKEVAEAKELLKNKEVQSVQPLPMPEKKEETLMLSKQISTVAVFTPNNSFSIMRWARSMLMRFAFWFRGNNLAPSERDSSTPLRYSTASGRRSTASRYFGHTRLDTLEEGRGVGIDIF